MGLLDNLFTKKQINEQVKGYFKTLNAYTPVFSSFSGGAYEMELTRACVHTFASQVSKLKPVVSGSARPDLNNILQFQPNQYMDTTKFIYRLATILECENNAFIVPIYKDDFTNRIVGFYPVHPAQVELRTENDADLWMTYRFSNGQKATIEFNKVGIINKYLFRDDFFGEDNKALNPTMQLMNVQNQGIVEGVKQSANIRFLARLANVYKSSDISDERKRFTKENLSAENNSGVLMFDNKYADVKQIDSKPFVVDADQMAIIKNNVFSYFGCSEGIIQNKWTDDEWNAYYEGKIEPFAIQLSLVLSNMLFSPREIAAGNKVVFSANRLQYAKNDFKLNMVTQLFDRGMMNKKTGCEIFDMPYDGDDGEKYYIRKEYAETDKLNEAQGLEGDANASKSKQGIPNDAPAVDGQQGEKD